MIRLYGWLISLGLGVLIANQSFAWNSFGHRLVAQIALDNMTPQARHAYNHYNYQLDKSYASKSLVSAAPWLDTQRSSSQLWLLPFHYINIPFSRDHTKLLEPNSINAVVAIEDAMRVLNNKSSSTADKGFYLRILLHVVGDIHQPMHTVSEYTWRFPRGDKGGNRVYLAKNPVANNLHAYWDNGGGWLKPRQKYSSSVLIHRAKMIEKRWPCRNFVLHFDPKAWANESHQLAISKAYTVKLGHKPSKAYQHMVSLQTQKQIALAGCRLAFLLNRAASSE